MADMSTDDAARAIKLANSLNVEDVPAKLRCGMCNKLAVEAVKLICCSTSICGPCSHEVPETCPVCTHSPVSAEDCSPDKKLRTTVKAFIKTEEKKRSKNVELAAAPRIQAPTPLPGPSEAPKTLDAGDSQAGAVDEANVDQGLTSAEQPGVVEAENAEDTQPNGAAAADGDADQDEEEEEDDDDDVIITVERPEHEKDAQAYSEQQQLNQDYGEDNRDQNYGESANGQQQMGDFGQQQQQQGFGNGDFGNMNNFNPMTAMQNGMGMGNFGMGMPNMMGKFFQSQRHGRSGYKLRGWRKGMAGMNMDPAMMFNGFGGMGDMSAMMNMGMGGMNGMNGMGGFGGMPGGMNMNMGGGPGNFFGPHAGGYNGHHQQFGNQVNAPFQQQRGYYNRGRGNFARGRGFYPRGGRGGFNAYNQFPAGQKQNYMNRPQSQGYQAGNNDVPPQNQRRGSPVYEAVKQDGSTTNDSAKQDQQSEVTDTNHAEGNAATNDTGEASNVEQAGLDVVQSTENAENGGKPNNSSTPTFAVTDVGLEGTEAEAMDVQANENTAEVPQPDQMPQSEAYQQGPGYGGGQGGRSSFKSQASAYGDVTMIGGEQEPAPAPPVNAPTGPKAMRQGLPNTGWYSRPQQQQQAASSVVAPTPTPETNGLVVGRGRHDRSRTRSRSPARHHSRKDRERTPDYSHESDQAYAQRKEREREKRKAKEREERERRGEDVNGDHDGGKVSSRSESLNDRERRKHRDRHDDRHSSRRERSRDGRRHRDRSRSPDKAGSAYEDASDYSRRKSKSDRKREDYDDHDRGKDGHSSRRHSRRDDDHSGKDRSRHSRSTRDDDKARDREKRKADAEPEDLGFSIKGMASQNKRSSVDAAAMAPPPTKPAASSRSERRSSARDEGSSAATTPKGDHYAEDRQEMIKARLKKHESALGKRSSRIEEVSDGAGGARGKRQRQDTRKHSARYEA